MASKSRKQLLNYASDPEFTAHVLVTITHYRLLWLV